MSSEKFIDAAGTPRLLVLSGAGLSAESGISTFRDSETALWEGVNINDVCNIARLDSKYHKIHSFYNTLRVMLKDKEPNDAHYFLSVLESQYGDNFLHMTANVDDLCERAGSSPIHLHGNIKEVIECYSMAHNGFKVLDVGYEPYIPKDDIFAKPNVVFIGESERYVDGERIPLYEERNKIIKSLTYIDTVIIIGSSNTILRWSDIVGLGSAAFVVNVNVKKNDNDWVYERKIYKPVTKAITELQEIINERMK